MKSKIYPQLQIVRAFAAIMVVLNHTLALKFQIITNNIYFWEKWFTNFGVMGLTLFFCLSGFLITNLLLLEKSKNNKINFKFFYIRRILRIWPLYYLVIILGHLILPFTGLNISYTGGVIMNNYFIKTILYFLFLPNYVYFLIKPHNLFVDATWSIGVEEQFYLLWPLLISNSKKIIQICIIFIIIQLILEIILSHLAFVKNDTTFLYYTNKILRSLDWTRVGYFATGALFAYYFQNNGYKSSFLKYVVKYSPYYFSFIFIIVTKYSFTGNFLLLALSFAPFIIWLIKCKEPPKNIITNFLLWLGKISYGIYLWHGFVLIFVFNFLDKFKIHQNIECLLYIIVLILTFIISHFSYYLFEKKFLKFKYKFNYKNETINTN